jgi:2-polyprenyl-3-methyl-5-hydroxy-6-metoxy-1,4-benzoquinol methylase
MPNMSAEPYTGTQVLELLEQARNYNRFLLRTVQRWAPRSARIVDFGAGTGTTAIPLLRSGRNVLAVELDSLLQTRLRTAGLSVVGRIEELPSQHAHVVYTLNVLEHIAQDVDALRAINSRLTPGGRLIIYVPAFGSLFSNLDRQVGHFRRYTRADLAEKVARAGFTIIKNEYVDSLGFIAAWVFKKLGRQNQPTQRQIFLYDRVLFPVSRVFDLVFKKMFGKNVLLIAKKPDHAT